MQLSLAIILATLCIFLRLLNSSSAPVTTNSHASKSHWLPAVATWYGSANGDGSDGKHIIKPHFTLYSDRNVETFFSLHTVIQEERVGTVRWWTWNRYMRGLERWILSSSKTVKAAELVTRFGAWTGVSVPGEPSLSSSLTSAPAAPKPTLTLISVVQPLVDWLSPESLVPSATVVSSPSFTGGTYLFYQYTLFSN